MGCVNSVSYLRQVGGCLKWGVCISSVYRGRVCVHHKLVTVHWRLYAGGCVICQLLQTVLRISAGVCNLSVTSGRFSFVCSWSVNSATYLRQVDSFLQGVCKLSVT